MIRTVGFSVGLLLLVGGCYNPNSIKNGGLVCNSGAVACPDGFACNSGHCWKNGTGPDGGGTSPLGSDADSAPACTTATGLYGPFAACSNTSYPNSVCDPVCQSGCPCGRRCILDIQTSDRFSCEATPEPAGFAFVPPIGTCSPPTAGACAPGSLCIGDDLCPNICYKTCRADSDCGVSGRCTRLGIVDQGVQTVPNLYFCAPPIETCNPAGLAACASPRANFNCVFVAGLTGVQNTDATTCDCGTLHSHGIGATCDSVPTDNCQPGAVCVAGTCRRVCNQNASGTPCPVVGGGCMPIYGSTKYGYCR